MAKGKFTPDDNSLHCGDTHCNKFTILSGLGTSQKELSKVLRRSVWKLKKKIGWMCPVCSAKKVDVPRF